MTARVWNKEALAEDGGRQSQRLLVEAWALQWGTFCKARLATAEVRGRSLAASGSLRRATSAVPAH
jgi:hypothetical protein